jgi:hypothetical protein
MQIQQIIQGVPFVVGLCLLAGCSELASPANQGLGKTGQQESPWALSFKQDSTYLGLLNAKVKEGALSDSDRERLWQAYVARLHADTRVGDERWWSLRRNPIVPPAF